MSRIPHPRPPWTSSYLVDRIREVIQNENLANWKKSYVEKRTTGVHVVLHEDVVTNMWGARPHAAIAAVIEAGGWDGSFIEVDGVKIPYVTFSIQPKQES